MQSLPSDPRSTALPNSIDAKHAGRCETLQTVPTVAPATFAVGRDASEILSRVEDGFLAFDANARFTYLNPRALTLMGRQRESELLGRQVWAEFPDVVGTPFFHAFERAMRNQEPVLNISHLTPLGRLFEGRLYPSHDGLSIYFTDITVRHQSELALRESEQRYRLAASPGHLWHWDVRKAEVFFGAPFWHMFDMPTPKPTEVLNAFMALLHPDDLWRWRKVLGEHLAQRGAYDMEFRARGQSGRWRWFQTQGQAMWDDQGRATYMAGTTFEITERKEAEENIKHLQFELTQLSRRLLDQEKNTTRRLAQSLHDNLGQTLAVARLSLDACMTVHGASMPAALRAQGQQISKLMDQAVSEVRQALADLRPPLLEEQGLASAFENDIRFSAPANAGVDVLLEVADSAVGLRWPGAVEYAGFMVAREATMNALQHAQASLIRVVLEGDAQHLQVHVIDDGCGIELPMISGRVGHLGLVGMRERCLSIGARFEVALEAQGGTRVSLLWQADLAGSMPAPEITAK
jgi:signal transduction histidine kinase